MVVRSSAQADEADGVSGFHVKHPSALVQKQRDVSEGAAVEHSFTPLLRALHGERGARQDDADGPAVSCELPKPPAEALIQVRVAGSHTGIGACKKGQPKTIVAFNRRFVRRDQVGPVMLQANEAFGAFLA